MRGWRYKSDGLPSLTDNYSPSLFPTLYVCLSLLNFHASEIGCRSEILNLH